MTHTLIGTALSRRDWLRLAAAGALGSSTSGWIETLAAERRGRPPAPQGVHPALDERRAEPDRHLRPQAGPRQRRHLQGDRDGRAGHRRSASTCPSWRGR